eukprot:5861918-Prymnesium_polylepis.2
MSDRSVDAAPPRSAGEKEPPRPSTGLELARPPGPRLPMSKTVVAMRGCSAARRWAHVAPATPAPRTAMR